MGRVSNPRQTVLKNIETKQPGNTDLQRIALELRKCQCQVELLQESNYSKPSKDFYLGSSAVKVQSEQGVSKFHKEQKGFMQGEKRLDIKDNGSVSPEQNRILASVFSRMTLNVE